MGEFIDSWKDASRFSSASGDNSLPYVVLQVTLKEKVFGTGSGNLTDLEEVINNQVRKGYRLHTMSTSNGGSKGFAGGDRIQATLVFERLDFVFHTSQGSNNQNNYTKIETEQEAAIAKTTVNLDSTVVSNRGNTNQISNTNIVKDQEITIVEPKTSLNQIDKETNAALIEFQTRIRNETSTITIRKIWRETNLGKIYTRLDKKIEESAEVERSFGRGLTTRFIKEICEMIENEKL